MAKTCPVLSQVVAKTWKVLIIAQLISKVVFWEDIFLVKAFQS